jgi:hypothetical protein
MKHITILASLAILLLQTSICKAGAGKEAILKGKSETGKVQVCIRKWDIDGAVSKAQLILGQDTINFDADCDAYSVIELPNHLLTMCFQQKCTTPGAADTKSFRIWGVPSSFVQISPGSVYNWRFKAKIQYSAPGLPAADIQRLDCTMEWNP